MRKLLLLLLTAATIVTWSLTFRPTLLGGPAGYMIVSGRSMEPTYYTGDLVVTREQSEYHAGDIVTYRKPEGKVIHRIIGGNGVDGFRLQGDNNGWVDPELPRQEDIIGAAWLHVPGGGDYFRMAREPAVAAAAVAGFAGLALFSSRWYLAGARNAPKGHAPASGLLAVEGGTAVLGTRPVKRHGRGGT